MDEYTDDDELIDEMYNIVEGFDQQADLCEVDDMMLKSVHSNLKVPDFTEIDNE